MASAPHDGPPATTPLERFPSTLYLVRAQLGPDASAEAFSRWYDEEHVPALQACPGFGGTTRFTEIGHDRSYLAAYAIDGPEVFETPAYRAATGWRQWREHIVHQEAAVFDLQAVRPAPPA